MSADIMEAGIYLLCVSYPYMAVTLPCVSTHRCSHQPAWFPSLGGPSLTPKEAFNLLGHCLCHSGAFVNQPKAFTL